jgi:hypothetical protein
MLAACLVSAFEFQHGRLEEPEAELGDHDHHDERDRKHQEPLLLAGRNADHVRTQIVQQVHTVADHSDKRERTPPQNRVQWGPLNDAGSDHQHNHQDVRDLQRGIRRERDHQQQRGDRCRPDTPDNRARHREPKPRAGHDRGSGTTWCADSQIPELLTPAAASDRWWPEINAFLTTGITNARTEGYNRLLKQVKRVGCGFKNREHSARRIRFHCTRKQRAATQTSCRLPG